jgi:hypothetical protein
MKNGKFITVINCMDGRVQLPVIEWLKKNYKADFIDTITEPGPNKILSERKNRFLIESIKKKNRNFSEKTFFRFDCLGRSC